MCKSPVMIDAAPSLARVMEEQHTAWPEQDGVPDGIPRLAAAAQLKRWMLDE